MPNTAKNAARNSNDYKPCVFACVRACVLIVWRNVSESVKAAFLWIIEDLDDCKAE
jgi:hypothetical protein